MPLLPYQIQPAGKLFRSLLKYGAAADESETGVGKTPVALAVMSALMKTGKIKTPPTVITLRSVVPSWKRWAETVGVEVDVHSYQWAQRHLGEKRVHGTGFRWLWTNVPEAVVFDEAQATRALTSVNSKMLISAKNQGSKFIHLMSATLFASPVELKAIGFALGLHQNKNFYHWALANGAKPGVFGGWAFPQETARQRTDAAKALAKIRASLADKSVKILRSEIDFPPVTKDVLLLEDEDGEAEKLSEEAYSHYVDMRAAANETEHKLVEILRMRQALEILKVPQLLEQAEAKARYGSVAFFVNFDATAELLTGKLTKMFGSCEVIKGGQSARERQRAVDAYQNNLVQAIVVNLKAGGAGLSLHDPTGKVERTSFFLPSYSAVDLVQGEGRDHRQGGARARHYYVYFDNPVERRVAKILEHKFNNLGSVTDADLLGLSSY